MNIKCLGSGSTGNCWILEEKGKALIVDCGVPIMSVKKGLNFNLLKVNGVIVTHSHKDHELSAKELENIGLDVWKPYEGNQEIQKLSFGDFEVIAFPLPHDGVENRGFVIKNGNYCILYATDFEFIPYIFKNKYKFDTIIIEANYSKSADFTNKEYRDHVYRGHAEIQTTVDFIEKNKTENLKTVILSHLSESNADKESFIDLTAKVFNGEIYVARKGLELHI